MILLLSGKMNSGKDTFAQMLMDECPHPVERLKFADPLKDILAETFDVTREELERLKDEGEPYRGYLQRFGSGKMKEFFGDDVWAQLALERCSEEDTLYIIDDFRFPIEHLPGSFTVRIHRVQLPDTLVDVNHISETALDDFVFDYDVYNNGTMEELRTEARKLLEYIGWE